MSKAARTLLFTVPPAAILLTLAFFKTDAERAIPPDPFPSTDSVRDGQITVNAAFDRQRVWTRDGVLRVEMNLKSHHIPTEGARVPTDLVVILDKSGSMDGGKIEDARRAAIEMLAQLEDGDRFALVTYDNAPHLQIPLSEATADRRARWTAQIREINAGGSTNMVGGLQTAVDSLATPASGRAQRAILISDGLPDTQAGLSQQARWFATHEAPLTTVGIGADYDEQLMSSLADAGTGNFYWVQHGDNLASVFADEFSTAKETVATGLQVQHTAGTAGELLAAAAGYTPTSLSSHKGAAFDVGSLYASQERRFWLTFRLPEGYDATSADLGALTVSWRTPDGVRHTADIELPDVEVTADRDHFIAGLDKDQWARAVLDEEFNAVRAEVSALVQQGDQKAALERLDTYKDQTAALNRTVGSGVVWDNIAEVEEMRSEVKDTFTGENQRHRRNMWSKQTNMDAYSTRRSGQSKRY